MFVGLLFEGVWFCYRFDYLAVVWWLFLAGLLISLLFDLLGFG